tara:strand:+ start:510 stop:785 length:276 start_codon:yes stop_codon:yes gene_type:complete
MECSKKSKKDAIKFLSSVISIDFVDFVDLTMDDVKNLPIETRLCIESLVVIEKTLKNGNVIKTVKIKMLNKIKAIELLAKQIGFYEIEKQK